MASIGQIIIFREMNNYLRNYTCAVLLRNEKEFLSIYHLAKGGRRGMEGKKEKERRRRTQCARTSPQCSSSCTSWFMLCSQQRIVESSVSPPACARPRVNVGISGQQYHLVAAVWCRGSRILGVGPRHAPGIRVDQTEHRAHLCSHEVACLRRATAVVKAKERKSNTATNWPLDIIILLRERNVALSPSGIRVPWPPPLFPLAFARVIWRNWLGKARENGMKYKNTDVNCHFYLFSKVKYLDKVISFCSLLFLFLALAMWNATWFPGLSNLLSERYSLRHSFPSRSARFPDALPSLMADPDQILGS